MLAVGGLLFVPLSVAGLWFLSFESPRPQNLLEWIVRVLLEELAIGATLFFSLGFLWGMTGHPNLKRILDAISVRFAWILIPMSIPVLATVVWFLLCGL